MDLKKKLQWSDDWITDIETLDDEHRELIRRHLVLAELSQSAAPLSQFREETKALSEALETHFHSEEQVMRELEYPGSREHKAAHQRLLEELADFSRSIGVGLSGKDLPAVAKYLRYAFVSHVKKHDTKLKDYAERPRPEARNEASP